MAVGWGSKTWGAAEWGDLSDETVTVTSAGLLSSTNFTSVTNFNALANAQISTDQSKFGGSSLELDGSSDRIQSGDITLGSDSYTWETFAYFNSLSSTQGIWDAGENVGASQNPVVYITATNIQISYAGGTYINVAHGMSTDTWHHIAIVRDGTGTGNLKAYIDGINVGTGNLGAIGAGATNHVLGGNFAGTFTMDGYLDESRLTRRVVYTGNFTPPTQAFTNDSSTDIWLLHYDGANGSTTILNSAKQELDITADGSVVPTGINATSSTGTASAFSVVDVVSTGTSATISVGDESISTDVSFSVTGSSSSTAIGTATIDDEILTGVGWGRSSWGSFAWSVTYSVEPTAATAQTSVGSVDLQIDQDIFINVTEHTLTTQIGNEDAFTDIDVSVTGQGLSSAIGTESSFTDVDIDLTGLSLSANIGDVVAGLKTPVDVTTAGILSTAIGQAEADDSSAETTGIELTTGIGSATISSWNEVDTGTEVTWSDVGIAA